MINLNFFQHGSSFVRDIEPSESITALNQIVACCDFESVIKNEHLF